MSYRQPLTASLTGEGFSPAVFVSGGFNFSAYGAFSARVTVQRSFDGGATWLDVVTVTQASELAGQEPEGALYRFGVKPGAYGSGTISGRLGQ